MWAVLLPGCSPACSFNASGAAQGADSGTGETGATGSEGEASSGTADGGTTGKATEGDATAGEASSSEASDTGLAAAWWDENWTRRRRVSVSGANTETLLSNVPLLLVVSASQFELAQFAAGGVDLRFVSADGTTVLPHEIERWTPDGTSHVWFRMDGIEPNDSQSWVWLYWGNPEAQAADDPAEVWSNGYRGVWHFEAPLDGDPAPYVDSAQGLEAHPSLGVLESPVGPGWVGRGVELDGVDDHFVVDPLASDDWSALVVEAWIFPRSSNGRIACKTPNLVDEAHVWCLGLSDGDLDVWLSTDGNEGQSVRHTNLATPPAEEWSWVAAAWDASTSAFSVYVNGVPLMELEHTGGTLFDSDQSVVFGNANDFDAARYQGELDELRVSSVSRSPGWFAVQAQSMNDDLLELGPVEQR